MASWLEFMWKVCPLLGISLQHFVVLDLLMCSGVVVADRKANKGTGRWPGLGQGGDSVGGDSSVPALCHCPCPAQLWQLEAPGAVAELQLCFSSSISPSGWAGQLQENLPPRICWVLRAEGVLGVRC